MLAIPLEKLAYIITKAREFDVEVPPIDKDSGSNPADDAEWDVLQSGTNNPTYQDHEVPVGQREGNRLLVKADPRVGTQYVAYIFEESRVAGHSQSPLW